MKKLQYRVRFITPAFLGNAEQKGQWRVPPFKALLRQWWRVAYAKEVGYNWKELKKEEDRIFGSASDDSNERSRKSMVRLRLNGWKTGTMEQGDWPGGPLKKVITTRDGQGSVRSDVYLGFGPVLPPSRKQRRMKIELGSPPAVSPGEEAILEIQFNDQINTDHILEAMRLAHYFGSVGSRARNGWGSIEFTSSEVKYPLISSSDEFMKRITRPINDCLNEDWSHAIGVGGDGKPLIWLSKKEFTSWREAIDFLADIKVSIRRKAKSISSDIGIGGIHFLGYPAGDKWTMKEWESKENDKQKRYACQVRFKVVRSHNGNFHALITHLPHSFPPTLMDRLSSKQRDWIKEHENSVWNAIHNVLNTKVGRL